MLFRSPKIRYKKFKLENKFVSVAGIAKGSGMIAPNMATMLAFIITDVKISYDILTHEVQVQAYSTCGSISTKMTTPSGQSILGLSSQQSLLDDRIAIYSGFLDESDEKFNISTLKKHVLSSEFLLITDLIKTKDLKPITMKGTERTVINVIGDERKLDIRHFQAIRAVEKVIPVLKPYKLASRETHPENTVIEVNGVKIGGDTLVKIGRAHV